MFPPTLQYINIKYTILYSHQLYNFFTHPHKHLPFFWVFYLNNSNPNGCALKKKITAGKSLEMTALKNSGIYYLPEPPCDSVHPPPTLWPTRPRLSELFFPTAHPPHPGWIMAGPQLHTSQDLDPACLTHALRLQLAGHLGNVPLGSSTQQLQEVLPPCWTRSLLSGKWVAWYRSHSSEREELRHSRIPPLPGQVPAGQSPGHFKSQGSIRTWKDHLGPEIFCSKSVHAANQLYDFGTCRRLNIEPPIPNPKNSRP